MACIMAAITSLCHAQSVIVQNIINMPKDSVTKNQLIGSLNGFLDQKGKPIGDNTFVLKENLLETAALMDELKLLDRKIKTKDDVLYRYYVTNIVKLNDDDFIIQLSYMGISENAPLLRASFKLKAKRENGQFYFLLTVKAKYNFMENKTCGKHDLAL